MEIKIKERSLSSIFLQYLLAMASGLVLLAIILFVSLEAGFYHGLYVPAKVIKDQLMAQTDIIASVYPFDPQVIPRGVSYALFGHDGQIITSDMSPEDREEASLMYQEGPQCPLTFKRPDVFWRIDRPDGAIIIQYRRTAYYTDPWLQAHLPGPEILAVFFFLLSTALLSLLVTGRFAKKLHRNLQPMINAAQQISDQDLGFDIKKSEVKEFNLVLKALSDMKGALGQALQKQWALEVQRKDQTAALAHDIKTPLTIIHGNAELLQASDLDEDQAAYTSFILKNADRMADHLAALVQLNASNQAYSAKIRPIKADDFVAHLKEDLLDLAQACKRKVRFSIEDLPDTIKLDPDLICRAMLNLMINAIEHSPEASTIAVAIGIKEGYLSLTTTDPGPGFSKEALIKGKDPFYRSDASRKHSGHYGIGLYTCDRIAQAHQGHLYLENDLQTGGARVRLEIPC